MSDAATEGADTSPRASRLPLLLGVVLAIAGAGGGFYAVSSGLIRGGGSAPAGAADTPAANDPAAGAATAVTAGDIAFVELPPLLVSLGDGASNSHLRFHATLEVPTQHAEEVRMLTPRVLDAMNSYLRALRPADIEAADALIVIRAQLTRRVQLVLGNERVRDLLVLEFVLN